MMRPRGTVLLLTWLAGWTTALPVAAATPLSFRVRQVEQSLQAWVESGGRTPLEIPGPYRAAVSGLPESGGVIAAESEPHLALLIRTSDPEFLRMSGFAVQTVAGPVATAQVPLSRVHELASVPGVIQVDLARQLRPLLDVSRFEIRANQAHGSTAPPYPGSTGAGVVVGIIDTGIDLDHPDFLNADATTRITRVWDQTDLAGPNPAGFNYGTEWTSTAINAGTARERDLDGHGTHVAGIAAGNGRASTGPGDQWIYAGIAPEAEIMVVKTNFLESGIIDALDFLSQRAGVKPMVANLSLGAQYGPHDGTGSLDVAVSSFSGPGRIIVAAAGNEANDGIHAQFTVPPSGIVQFPLQIGSYSPTSGSGNDRLYIDGWSSGSNFSTSVITPSSTTVGPVATNPTNETSTASSTAQGYVVIAQAPDPANGDRILLIDLTDQQGTAPASGTWTIRVQNVSSTTASELDLWISANGLGSGASVQWSDGNQVDESELISTPASGDSVIAVGAYVTKTSWACIAFPSGCAYSPQPPLGSIASFSSPGPRRDGWQKPEISAPGMGIVSTLSSNATSGLFTSNLVKLPGGLRVVSQGTSQASPHITGTVALLLQNRPNASFDQVTQTLILTSREDSFTGVGFSPYFGHGKVDTKAAVDLVVPVRLLSLSALWEDGAAVLRWSLAETEPGVRFQVERGPAASGPFTLVGSPSSEGLVFSWTDPSPSAAEPWYRLVSWDRTGEREVLGTVELGRPVLALRLLPNAPNPFQGSTVIAFQLARTARVTLEILDLSGRRVTTLVSGSLDEGLHEIEWNGTDAAGRHAASGIYFYRLITPEGVLARRMVRTS